MTQETDSRRGPVSEKQQRLLDDFQAGKLNWNLAECFSELVEIEEIQNGTERIHPGWIDLFGRYRNGLASEAGRFLPDVAVRRILDVFDPLLAADNPFATLDPYSEEIAFLLGAGASKPKPSNIPTVAELLDQLLDRARRLDREEMTNLAEFCKYSDIQNIEDLLTAVQISAFCSRKPTILRLVEFQLFGRRRPRGIAVRGRTDSTFQQTRMRADVATTAYLQETFELLFGLLSNLMLPSNPNDCHQAIAEYIQTRPGTSIVTTNYDCCMDRSLIKNDMDFSYVIDFANHETTGEDREKAIQLIKLHGSLNWFNCETCQTVRLLDIEQAVSNYEKDLGIYPIINVCRECGGPSRGLLVPPHAMKFDVSQPLQPLLEHAAKAFSDRSLIIVVGFSFSEADMYISRMLIKAMQSPIEPKLLIVDPAEDLLERIRLRFESQIPQFDAYSRIIGLQGDCAKVLPEFLRGELLKTGHSEPSNYAEVS